MFQSRVLEGLLVLQIFSNGCHQQHSACVVDCACRVAGRDSVAGGKNLIRSYMSDRLIHD